MAVQQSPKEIFKASRLLLRISGRIHLIDPIGEFIVGGRPTERNQIKRPNDFVRRGSLVNQRMQAASGVTNLFIKEVTVHQMKLQS